MPLDDDYPCDEIGCEYDAEGICIYCNVDEDGYYHPELEDDDPDLSILWDAEGTYKCYALPEFLERHIFNFDMGRGMEPFSFALDLTNEISEPGVQ